MALMPSETYLTLIHEFPLHPLRTTRDYDRAAALLDRLVVRDEDDLDAGERNYLATLELLIGAYDEEHFRVDPSYFL